MQAHPVVYVNKNVDALELQRSQKAVNITLPTVKLNDALWLLCILWHWKTAASGRQDGFIELLGNPRIKRHTVSEEAGPSNRTMIPSLTRLSLLGCRRSP